MAVSGIRFRLFAFFLPVRTLASASKAQLFRARGNNFKGASSSFFGSGVFVRVIDSPLRSFRTPPVRLLELRGVFPQARFAASVAN